MSILELSPLFPSASSISKSNERSLSPASRSGSIRSELKDNGIRGVNHKLLEELIQDNVDRKLITEEIENLSEEYDLKAVNWRQRMIHFLHSRLVGGTLLCLVLLDVALVLVNVIIELKVMQDQNYLLTEKNKEIRQMYRCNCSHTGHTGYASNMSSDDVPVVDASNQGHIYDSIEVNVHTLEKINSVLHYCSMAVLVIFVMEVVLKFIGYGLKLFRSKMESIDAFVVIASFTLDLVLLGSGLKDDLTKTVFIIPFLLWRLMRVLNALSVTLRMRNKFRLQILRKSKKAADEKIRDQTIECSDKAAEIKRLQNIARRHGAEEHELQTAKVLSKSSVTSQPAICSMAAKTVIFTNILGYKHSLSESCVNNAVNRRHSEINDRSRHQYKYASSLGINSIERESRRRSAMFDTDGPYTRMKNLGKSSEDVKQNYLTVQSSYTAAVANEQEEARMSKCKQQDSTEAIVKPEKKKSSAESFDKALVVDEKCHSNGVSNAEEMLSDTQTSSDASSTCIYTRLLSRRAKESLTNPPIISISHVDDA